MTIIIIEDPSQSFVYSDEKIMQIIFIFGIINI